MLRIILSAILLTLGVSTSFAADKMLADRHVDRGVKCESCHTTTPPKPVSSQQCLTCHESYEKLAARTDNKDINPHDTHLDKPDCSGCHRVHKKSVLICDECHEFNDLRVP